MGRVDSMGNSIAVSGEMTARELMQKVTRVVQGEIIGDVNGLPFRDLSNFRAGELYAHYSFCEKVAERCPKMAAQTVVWLCTRRFCDLPTYCLSF